MSQPVLPPHTPPAASPARNFAWSVGGRAFRVGLSIAVGAWVARYLGPSRYGELASVQATIVMLLAFVGLGLDSLVRQELVRRRDASDTLLGTCMALRLTAGAIAYLVLAFVAWADAELRLVWLVLGSTLVTHVPLSIDFWFQARGQLRHSAVAQNIAFAIASLLRIVLIALQAPLVSFAALIVLEGPVAAGYLFVVYRRQNPGRFEVSGAIAREWLRNCWPLFIASVVTTAFARLDQSLLLWLAGPAEAGRFAVATRVVDLVVFLPTALVTALLPGIAEAAQSGGLALNEATRRALDVVSGLSWLLSLGVLAGAGWIVRELFGAAYADSDVSLRILAIAVLFHGAGLVRAEAWIAARGARRLLVVTIVGVLLNAGLALWWIPSAGAIGAAWATAISMTIGILALNLFWRDTRAFSVWQLQALAGAVIWRRTKADSP